MKKRRQARDTRRHGPRYSAQSREIRALGRVLNRVADLATAQIAVMNLRARGDPQRVEISERRLSQSTHRQREATLALDRVLVEREDEAVELHLSA